MKTRTYTIQAVTFLGPTERALLLGRFPCPTCGGKGYVECEVVVEVQLGDEAPYDSTIARYTGQALKRRQRVEDGVWDCPDCDEGGAP